MAIKFFISVEKETRRPDFRASVIVYSNTVGLVLSHLDRRLLVQTCSQEYKDNTATLIIIPGVPLD